VKAQPDQELLREYAEGGSEAAFAELVRRYVDFIYSAAFRMVRNPQLAEEVTQSVFVALSQSAGLLARRAILSGWLHRTARNLAAKAVRTEVRRRSREQEAALMNESSSSESEREWERIAPQLDGALDELREADRDIVLLRFFHQRSSREIADSFGLSEEAAKKRVARAVERLRNILLSRGVAVSAVALAAGLTANSVHAAPAGMAAAAISGASAAAGASTGASPVALLLKALATTKLQASIIGLLFMAGVATPVILNPRASLPAERPFKPASTVGGASQATVSAQSTRAAPERWEMSTNTPLGRLAAWVRELDETHQPYEPWSIDEDEMDHLIWSLPLADYSKAWRLREGLRYEEIRNRLERHLLSNWAELEPRAALAAAVSLNGSWVRFDPAIGVLESWAQKEPVAALAWVRQSVPEKSRASVLSSVIPQVAAGDPEAALAALEEIPSGMLRKRAQSGVVRAWAAQSPVAAAIYVTNLQASAVRPELVRLVADAWAQKDPEAAFQWAQGLAAGNEHDSAVSGALVTMAELYPALTAELIERLEGEDRKSARSYLFTLMDNWAKADLPAAAECTRQLWTKMYSGASSDPAQQSSDLLNLSMATEQLLEQWSFADARGAVDFALSLPGDKARQVQVTIAKWCTRDSQAALDFANGLPAGANRDAALKGVSEGLAEWNPAQAAEFVAKLPAGELQSQAAVEVVYRWALTDAKAAGQWVKEFPEGQTREGAAKRLMDGWAAGEGDLQAAVKWLEQLPAGPTRDKAAQAFVMGAAWKEPELAAKWVGAFADDALRNQQTEQIARKWLRTDPETAQKWLQSTSLPEARKQQLLAK
jgi:RNA polymerase sigma factor (sigma-70 family)